MKNKAFTLIELLAVIVILAIIALIAVPIILNIIEDTKDSSVIRSTELYLDAVELSIAREGLNNNQIGDGQYGIEEFTKVEVNGQAPSEGMIEITEDKITDYSLQIGEYVVNYDETKKKPTIGGNLRKAEFKPIVDLIEGMTAVQYIDNNWTVVDGTKKNWYNYNNQEWANAVILESGITKNIGDTVDVASEVKAMFVYVPRYEYRIEGTYGKGGTSTTSPGEIEINFISKNTTTASSGYRVHPAFTFGSEELNGIWVGKFETTGTGDIPTILPSIASLRSQNVSTQFATAQKFNSYIAAGDSHMMKNSEWGAVAYLSQSKYGKYGNSNYSGIEKEIRINNCSNNITGIGANSRNEGSLEITCTTNTYETANGQAASTTGNITGIYDMSGGAYEYVMGYLSGISDIWGSTSVDGNRAGFTSELESKYFDEYTNSTVTATTACNGGICYGHALSETSNWYGDSTAFVHSGSPWWNRGNSYNYTPSSSIGIFSTERSSGGGDRNHSFRVVIIKSNN